MAKDPATAAAKWARNMQNAGPTITAGVQAVQQAPTAKAAANLNAYLAGTQNAVSSGRMAKALNAVSLSAWQNAMVTKGVPRVGTGATAAQPKVQAALAKIIPAATSIASSLPPRGDIGANIQRAVQQAEQMHALKGTLGSSSGY